MTGFYIIDKPAGWTSHDVVARVRRLAGQKRVGHTGTLDPDATGVLLVCIGQATRLIEYTEGHHKVYEAKLTLGVETDSQDASGAVVGERDASGVTEAALREAAARLTGDILQIPPMVSAVHHEGQRLYELARQGIVVERKPRPVTVYRLDVESFTPGPRAAAALTVECSAGTYVRTLCHDIGEALGVGGHMAALRRTAVGPFGESHAVSLEALAEEGAVSLCLQSVDRLLPDWPVIEGSDTQNADVGHGKVISADVPGEWASFRYNGRLRAILHREGEDWHPAKVLPNEA
ncbi:MAG TPA: tRNA pseudouridine(55) synthase TruB [Armatimonadota bacterium]|jgi:tRNA pseudouridine55 synthase